MYTEEEAQYLTLHAKFTEELSLIEQQIIDLEARRDQLKQLLAGVPNEEVTMVFTPEEDNSNEAMRATIDEQLVQFLKAVPGANRAEINEGLAGAGWEPDEIEKSLKRCKNAGKIKREGATRNSTWSVS